MLHCADTTPGMLRPVRCDCDRVHHVTAEFIIEHVAVQCVCGRVLKSSGLVDGSGDDNEVGWWLEIAPASSVREAFGQYWNRNYPDTHN